MQYDHIVIWINTDLYFTLLLPILFFKKNNTPLTQGTGYFDSQIYSWSKDWSKVLDLHWMWEMLGTIFLSKKKRKRKERERAWKRTYTGILNQCKQEQDTNLATVYMRKNCELCNFLITIRLTLRFWLIIKMHFKSSIKN